MYKLPENLGSKYAFVSTASSRAEQLQTGALPRTKNPEGRKLTIIAQEEVATGLVQAVSTEVVAEETEEAPPALDEEE
ncbi:MAG: DNA-directed RNA polymerase subunit omega [Acidobacteria bacterium]|uniref:DNA-directed RNA polymerase subunit omega n=1 Tax=Candidatus Polarisedimenticola svalbardensis TaxID=2886004 RepID=A0A8J6Y8X6_9BACT|nr:DNA-directed RNA polymerase subunit omega [Candidatus Polarisedimenticola svalbardensis]